MTHINGSTVYPPAARFQIQRSYIQTLRWHTNPALIWAQDGGSWAITYPPLPGYTAYVKIKDGFWNWNSGRWYLKDIIEWAYEVYAPDPTELPLYLLLNAVRDAARGEFVLEFITFSGTTGRYDNLPARTEAYWTPDIIPTF